MTTSSPDAPAALGVRRIIQARLGVTALFASTGLYAGSFFSRVPSLRDALELTPSGIALLLLSGAVGSLASAAFTGWLAVRWGTRRLLWASNWAFLAGGLAVCVAILGATRLGFATSWFAFAVAFGVVNTVMNAAGADVERAADKAVMSQFHAAFAVALAAGVGLAAIASAAGLPLAWHLLAAAVVSTGLRTFAINAATIVPHVPEVAGAKRRGPLAVARDEYRDRRVLVLGIIAFTGSMVEMSAAEWTTLSAVDDYGLSEHLATLVYASFVVAMVAVRIAGPRVIDHLGRVAAVRWSAAASAVGVALFAFAPTPWALPVASALWGLGAGLVLPVVYSASSDDPARAAATVAAVTSFSTVSTMISPQIIGFLAGVLELRHALLLLAIAAAGTFVVARAVETRNLQSARVG